MKRALTLLVLCVCAGVVLAQYPQTGVYPPGNKTIHYWFSPDEDVSDTVWIPDGQWGIDLTPYRYLGFDIHIQVADTAVSDSIYPHVYTGFYGPDSLTFVETLDSIPDDANATDRCKWFTLIDSAGTWWFNQFAFLRFEWKTTSISGTAYLDSTDSNTVTGATWGAAGDSMQDWNASSAGALEADVDEKTLDCSDYIYVKGSDSACVIPCENSNTYETGIIDSVVVWLVAADDSAIVSRDTIKFGLLFGDSALHHWGTFDSDTVQAFEIDSGETTTCSFSLATQPSGKWVKDSLDAMNFGIIAHRQDTTVNGDNGELRVFQVGYRAYYNRHFKPRPHIRATVYLKE